MSLPLVDISDLTVRRAGRPVLEGVSLAVEPSTIHALTGPNGAGKSTLMAAVLGQLPFTGSIKLHFRGDGRIGYVPQVFAADRTLPITVAEFLALGRQRWPVVLGVRRPTRATVDKLLDRVGLAGLARRRLGELSGGQLRRVLIANALDPIPELLLCDEPGAGLDAESARVLDEILVDLRKGGKTTVLLISHDAAQTERIADRVTTLGATGAAS